MPKRHAGILIAVLLLLAAGAAIYLLQVRVRHDCGDGRGNDYFDGGPGTDTITYSCATHPLFIDLADERARGADIGFDQIRSFEIIRAGLGDDLLLGSARGETLDGAAGNDRLMGRGGADVLIGGEGEDLFMFTARSGPDDIDEISGFDAAADTIGILGAEHPALTAPFGAAQLAIGSATVSGATRIIYEPSDGSLSYDPDGAGPKAAEQFATLASRPPSLEASQFEVVLEIQIPQ